MGRKCVVPLKVYNYLAKLISSLNVSELYVRNLILNKDNLFDIDIDENDKSIYGIESVEFFLDGFGELELNRIYVNANFYSLNFSKSRKIEGDIILTNVEDVNSIYFYDYTCLPYAITCELKDLNITIEKGLVSKVLINFLKRCQNCNIVLNEILLDYHLKEINLNDFIYFLTFSLEDSLVEIKNLSIVVKTNTYKQLHIVYKELVDICSFNLLHNTEFNLIFGGESITSEISNLFFTVYNLYSPSFLTIYYKRFHLYVFPSKKSNSTNHIQEMLDRFLKQYKYVFGSAEYKSKLSRYEENVYLNEISLYK